MSLSTAERSATPEFSRLLSRSSNSFSFELEEHKTVAKSEQNTPVILHSLRLRERDEVEYTGYIKPAQAQKC